MIVEMPVKQDEKRGKDQPEQFEDPMRELTKIVVKLPRNDLRRLHKLIGESLDGTHHSI